MKLSPVTAFFFKTLLWLPIAFGIWYYMAILLSHPAAWLTEWLLSHLLPDVIDKIWLSGFTLEVDTKIHPTFQAGMSAATQAGFLSTSVNPLIYGYSFPLYTALILASPESESKKWGYWMMGMLILFPVQAWGLSFDIIKTLTFQMGAAVSQHLNFARWQADTVAIGYQLGYLILPAVSPLVIWMAQHQAFLLELSPALKNLKK